MDDRAPDESLAESRADSLGRLKAFTDGTVAIALTLLVLPLVDVAGEADSRGPFALIADNGGTFAAFFLSFYLIATLWNVHRRTFAVLRDFDGGVVARLMVWLLAIVWLPFPTDLLFTEDGGEGLQQGGAVLYLASLLIATAANYAQGRYAQRHRELRHGFASEGMMDEARRTGLTALLVVALCTVVALVRPEVGLLGLWLMALTDRVDLPGLRRRRDAVPLPD